MLKTRRLLFSESRADEFGTQLVHLPDHKDRHISIPAEQPAHILTVGWRKHTHKHKQVWVNWLLKHWVKVWTCLLLLSIIYKCKRNEKWNQNMIFHSTDMEITLNNRNMFDVICVLSSHWPKAAQFYQHVSNTTFSDHSHICKHLFWNDASISISDLSDYQL